MKLIHESVNRPVGVIIIVLVVLMLGAVSLTGLGIDLMPEMELPIAVVTTSYQGAAPEDVENLVTRPLEGSLSAVEGLETMQSISSPNQSVIILMFDYGVDLDSSMLELRDRLDMVGRALPSGAGVPMVMRFDPNAMPIMQVGISGNMEVTNLTHIVEESILPRLERIPGVAQVNLTGGQEREIIVQPNITLMQDYHVTMSQLAQLIGAENRSAPAGQIKQDSEKMPLRIVGGFTSIKDILNLNIPLATGEVIKLSKIATVEDTIVESTSFSYVNGEPTLSLDIMKQSDANTVEVSNAVSREMERIKESLTQEVTLTTIIDSSLFITDSINSVVRNMALGGSMAILILLLFLRSFRSTLIIGLSIPIALISAFTLIYFSGNTLNILTLGGLALGIGLLVDSSIVILENIFKYRERGYSNIEAAKKGASEVAGAVIASTLTSVVVFVPIIFTGGLAAQIFMPLALTVGFILLASLIVAITLVPMLSRLLLPEIVVDDNPKGLRKIAASLGRLIEAVGMGYRKILKWSINHKKTIVFGTLLLLVASLAMIPRVGVEFIPEFDQGELTASFEMPVGTSLSETRENVSLLEEFLFETGAVEMVYTTIGGGGRMGIGGGSENSGEFFVRLVPQAERSKSTNELIKEFDEFATGIPDIEINVRGSQSGGTSGDPISIEVRGYDINTLKTIADELKVIISAVPGASNITHSMGETRPEIQIHVDKDATVQHGLMYAEVMQTIINSMNGQVATLMRVEGQEIDVKVILPEEYRSNLDQLKELPLNTSKGEIIQLSEVAEFTQAEGPAVINRQNQTRGVAISGDIIDRDLGSVMDDIERELKQYEFPTGYDYQIGGDAEMMGDTFSQLALALVLAIFLVYAVMAFQFEKVMYPFIVMFSLPVTVIGIIFGFLVTGRPLSAPAIIGVIMLAGIVVNNAIVLVDYINKLRDRGIPREEAILEAGQTRLRPILMTMLTTVLAMIPLAIGIGEGSELQAPMATVIVFGLTFSTLITLVLIPVMYIYMDNLTNWWKGLFTGRKEKNA
jgi:HAE1 family hydrophobic/amphiphilic exporter-1